MPALQRLVKTVPYRLGYSAKRLRPSGAIFGNDWNWDGIRCAGERRARDEGREMQWIADKWAMTKSGLLPG